MMGKLGILGGMGPLASAEFVVNLYRLNAARREQETPACVLESQPAVPDRTAAILDGRLEALTAEITRGLERLVTAGADRLLIACVTAHRVVPAIPRSLRRRLISLLDLMFEELAVQPRPLLLLATDGVRASGLLQDHPAWTRASDRLVLPDGDDQKRIHRRIYDLKACAPAPDALPWLDALGRRYDVDGFVFACTEFHLLHRHLPPSGEGPRIVDPLLTAARDLPRLLDREPSHPASPPATGGSAS